MSVSKKIEIFMSKASWIRKMFEEGARLKSIYGEENVYDFSLGNPNVQPPEEFSTALKDTVGSIKPNDHSYMPNGGYLNVRKSVASYLSKEQNTNITEQEILMTCGAAGALNVILKTILDPEDEIITPVPYFVEYGFYVDNHGGILKTASTKKDFTLDIDAISNAITKKTKGVLINSPNNPTGQVYSKENLRELGLLLKAKGEELQKTIYLISDEPYRKIIYDNIEVPTVFECYNNSIIATSHSKDLSIPGERIGYIAVNPKASYKEGLISGMTLSNRILGFVNAPALMQRVVSSIQGVHVDMSFYSKKRDLICNGLYDCGYEFVKPSGAFYLFPESPIPNDVEFVKALQEERILTVPGSGFGKPGYFRIAFCVNDNTIAGAMDGFKKVINKYK